MGHREPIWVIDDDHSIRWVLERALQEEGWPVQTFGRAEAALAALAHSPPAVVITDVRMAGMNGWDLLAQVRARHPDLPVIVITAHSDLDSAVSAYEGGAFEYLPKPFDLDEAMDLVRRALREREDTVPADPEPAADAPEILGEAPAMQQVFRAIGRLSRSQVTVLINGESGTGKELVARALHRHSPRAGGPFIALNTAAIPHDLLESELFGHERGAFTGAHSQRQGRFEQADGGTLFLDEIGDMPPDLQTRLLRVLADGEFYRVGGHAPVRADVRVIAATHQDLERRVRDGQFREDLFHRLNVIRIRLPALRERREDIPLLLHHFLRRAAQELGVEAKRVRPEVEAFLCGLDWPGNVRQLENACRWMTVMASGSEIHREDLPPELTQPVDASAAAVETDGWEAALRRWSERQLIQGASNLGPAAVAQVERTLMEAALRHCGGRRQEAAKRLGWGRNTLTRKLKEQGLEDPDS